ncbi:hypothetical protein TSUD_326940 [Trifolium subterraneum]|uniref:Reverse transcriptase Ty1/copia-type domain-containing protein n=1 Tax=Trifolium subterraneum TaxID=3900 RepID=A0A2Z6LU54_TRISU|nr:hypothetical protein TSUD_326940 [Trifolium subterraneum]
MTRSNAASGSVVPPLQPPQDPSQIPGNVYHVHPSDGPASVSVTPVLTHVNYHAWARSMRRALGVKNKYDFVDGTIPVPTPFDPSFKAWSRCNMIVHSWIMNSVEESIAKSIVYLDNAIDVWNELKERFSRGDFIRISELQVEIYSLKQGSRTVSEFFTALKILWEELEAYLPVPVCNCPHKCMCATGVGNARHQHSLLHVIRFLTGLNDTFDLVRSQILLMDPLPSINKIFSMVIQHERQFVAINGDLLVDESKAIVNASDSRRSYGRGRGYSSSHGRGSGFSTNSGSKKRICTFCGKDNHIVDNCYRKYGFPPHYGRNAEVSNVDCEDIAENNDAHSLKSTEKGTESFGLTKAQYERLVNLLQSTPSITPNSSTSAHANGASTSGMDSGASDHICSNLAFFDSYHDIIPIQVRMPNGTIAYAKIAGSVKFSSELLDKKSMKMIGSGELRDGLYYLNTKTKPKPIAAHTTSSQPSSSNTHIPKPALWHFRLGTKGVVLYDINNKNIFISRDIVHYDHILPYKTSNPTATWQYHSFDSDSSPIIHDLTDSSDLVIPPSIDNHDCDQNPLSQSPLVNTKSISQPTSNSNDTDNLTSITPADPSPTIQPTPPHRKSTRISTKPVHLSDYLCNQSSSSLVSSSSDAQTEPKDYKEASKHQCWIEAMNAEIGALNQNRTWVLVDQPANVKPIGSKWVYKVKHKADGSIERYKARLVAKGYNQIEGLDFFDTYSPVAKITTVRTLIALASIKSWHLHQMDVNNAFLHGELQEDVYMAIPQGVKVSKPNQVCKLLKSLYGLKQASRKWYERLTGLLVQQSYSQSSSDHSLFTLQHGHHFTALLVYVDDIILAGNTLEEINRIKQVMDAEFKIKDLGKLKYFLGIEVAHSSQGISICQRKYCLDLLSDTGLIGSKPAPTPFDPSTKLHQDSSAAYEDIEDWANCLDSRRSTSGYCFFLGSSLVSWRAKKQNTVSRSSSEAEYRALSFASCELQWLLFLLRDLGLQCTRAPVLYCDNQSAVHIASNPVFHERTKHLEIDCHFVHDKVLQGTFKLLPISSKSQIADFFTKPLPPKVFNMFISKLGMLNLYHTPACGRVTNMKDQPSLDAQAAEHDKDYEEHVEECILAVGGS